MNRVASAVGEGSMLVPFAHEYLALTSIGSLFFVSSSRDLVSRALLEMKHECDA